MQLGVSEVLRESGPSWRLLTSAPIRGCRPEPLVNLLVTRYDGVIRSLPELNTYNQW